ncbi:hypothetical protein Tco_1253943 [Tanacetum coccineum]
MTKNSTHPSGDDGAEMVAWVLAGRSMVWQSGDDVGCVEWWLRGVVAEVVAAVVGFGGGVVDGGDEVVVCVGVVAGAWPKSGRKLAPKKGRREWRLGLSNEEP